MRVRRLLATTLTATLVGSTAAVLGPASPAVAATETRIVSGTDGKPWLTRASSYREQPGPVVYGESLSLSINVEDADGNRVFDGTLEVQRRLAGSSAWKTVASSTSTSLYDSVKAAGNAVYRVLYSGSGAYAASSASASVAVQRALNDEGVSGRRLFLKGKVAPSYKRKPVTILRKDGKKWKKYKTVRTNAKGRFSAQVAAPRRASQKIRYVVYIKAGGGFSATASKVYTATKGYRTTGRSALR